MTYAGRTDQPGTAGSRPSATAATKSGAISSAFSCSEAMGCSPAPVYITDRGKPSHVLLTYDDYERLLGGKSITDVLGDPDGIEDVQFEPPRSREIAQPSSFD